MRKTTYEILKGYWNGSNQKVFVAAKKNANFAKPKVEYLGHVLSNEGISMGGKVDAVRAMPVPKNITGLRSFLGSVH